MTTSEDEIKKGSTSLKYRFIVHPSYACVSGGHHDRGGGGGEPSSKEIFKWFQDLFFLLGISTLEAHEKQRRGLQRPPYKLACKPWGNGIEKTSVCSRGFQVQAKHNYNNTFKGQKFDHKQGDKRSSAVSQFHPSQVSGDVPCPSGFFH